MLMIHSAKSIGHDAADRAVAGVAGDGAQIDSATAAMAMPRIAKTPPGEMKRRLVDVRRAPVQQRDRAKAITRITGHFTNAQIGRKDPQEGEHALGPDARGDRAEETDQGGAEQQRDHHQQDAQDQCEGQQQHRAIHADGAARPSGTS